MNFLAATVEAVSDGAITVAQAAFGTSVTVPRRHLHRTAPACGATTTLGLRPEHLGIADAGVALTVDLLESLGGSTLVHGRTTDGETVVLQVPGRPGLRQGERFTAGFAPDAAYLFDTQDHAL